MEGSGELTRISWVEAMEVAVNIHWPGIDELLRKRLPTEIEKEKSSLVRRKLEKLKSDSR